jgi:hypothetical protein
MCDYRQLSLLIDRNKRKPESAINVLDEDDDNMVKIQKCTSVKIACPEKRE